MIDNIEGILTQIRTGSRKSDLIVMKAAITSYLYINYDIGYRKVSKFLGTKNHTTAMNYLKKHETNLKYFEGYSKFYSELKDVDFEPLINNIVDKVPFGNKEKVYIAGKITGLEYDRYYYSDPVESLLNASSRSLSIPCCVLTIVLSNA